MKKATLYGAGVAILLALTGCTGEPVAGEGAPSKNAGSASSDPGGSSSTGPSQAPSSSAGEANGSQLTAVELEAVLTAVSEAEALNAQVIPDEQLRPLLEQGADQLGDVVVRPEECNAFAQSDLPELTAEANFAVMTFAGESSLQPDTVSLSSVASADVVIEQLASGREELQTCSEFEMELEGEVISASVKELEIQTEADEAIAVQTTVQVPGSIQESVTVTGILGGTSINVVVGSSGDPQADAQRAAGLVDVVVAELAALR